MVASSLLLAASCADGAVNGGEKAADPAARPPAAGQTALTNSPPGNLGEAIYKTELTPERLDRYFDALQNMRTFAASHPGLAFHVDFLKDSSMASQVRQLEEAPPGFLDAIKRAGLTPREFVVLYMAFGAANARAGCAPSMPPPARIAWYRSRRSGMRNSSRSVAPGCVGGVRGDADRTSNLPSSGRASAFQRRIGQASAGLRQRSTIRLPAGTSPTPPPACPRSPPRSPAPAPRRR